LGELLADADRLLDQENLDELRAHPPLGRLLDGLAAARRALAMRERPGGGPAQDHAPGGWVCVWLGEMLDAGRAVRAESGRLHAAVLAQEERTRAPRCPKRGRPPESSTG
jgi:hypothetical protein